MLKPLPEKVGIQTLLKRTWLTAVGGGGRNTDVIHTDAVEPRAWETFTLWVDEPDDSGMQNCAFQTVNGHFITAVNGGGMTSDAIHSDATRILGWEIFTLVPHLEAGGGVFAIQTQKGFFLTAVGGGGHNSGEPIHTDARNAREWEFFRRASLA